MMCESSRMNWLADEEATFTIFNPPSLSGEELPLVLKVHLRAFLRPPTSRRHPIGSSNRHLLVQDTSTFPFLIQNLTVNLKPPVKIARLRPCHNPNALTLSFQYSSIGSQRDIYLDTSS
jgi:hypothetical protein